MGTDESHCPTCECCERATRKAGNGVRGKASSVRGRISSYLLLELHGIGRRTHTHVLKKTLFGEHCGINVRQIRPRDAQTEWNICKPEERRLIGCAVNWAVGTLEWSQKTTRLADGVRVAPLKVRVQPQLRRLQTRVGVHETRRTAYIGTAQKYLSQVEKRVSKSMGECRVGRN